MQKKEIMKIKIKYIEEALHKSYKELKPLTTDIEKFVVNLKSYFQKLDENESEENAKINLINLLNTTYYQGNYYVNTKERADLVIHTDNTTKSNVGVIIETKRINSPDFPTIKNLNTKAFHQLILYYLRERKEHNNINIKKLIITDFYRWFIFDATVFDKIFFQNKSLLQDYEQWKNNQKVRTDTDLFYKDIAKPYVDNLQNEIECTFLDLNDYKENTNKTQIISLYKIFSPIFLLNEKQKNDNNTLNSKFYNELLHIIGIQETKDANKKVIKLKDTGDGGSLIENTIRKLRIHNNLKLIPAIKQYGETLDDQLFGIALELCINWLNRILFLKLLEAQIVKYHNQKKEYYFLTSEKIIQFEQLDRLFFEVLAVKQQDRDKIYKGKFEHIPYLNSSLFEPTDIERRTIYIDNLYNDLQLQVYSGTILKDDNKTKLNTKLPTLKYLLNFLNAYNFSSDSSELTIDYSNTLINSSVLGLIFEKINGYKEGAYFTPSFITMYMCRETIRRTVIDKFNEKYNWNCKYDNNLTELFNRLEPEKNTEYNDIINSITICDPAVGSGHFLVSALNEMINIKSNLKILCDKEGKRLKTYHIENINDELIIRDEENQEFVYTLTNKNKINPEKQRIQETLFNEKKQIIENCLFGVDINPNSVNITRLRLWIELLKNAYYTAESNYTELHTLPNIDINIKVGNSLLSRFKMDTDLSKALRGTKWNLFSYLNAVKSYKELTGLQAKKELLNLIAEMKSKFKNNISRTNPKYQKLQKIKSDLDLMISPTLIDSVLSDKAQNLWEEKIQKLALEQKVLEKQFRDAKAGVQYIHAFDWRFEFPEVIDTNTGNYIGFDIVMGNPPYIRHEEIGELKEEYSQDYQTYANTADLLVYFIELGDKILKKGGHFSMITANKWLRATFAKKLRNWLSNRRIDTLIDFGDLPVFPEATTYPIILSYSKTTPKKIFPAVNIDTLTFNNLSEHISDKFIDISTKFLSTENGWKLVKNETQKLIQKINLKGVSLDEYVNGNVFYGIKTGLNEAFVINKETGDKILSIDKKYRKVIKPFLAGKDVKRYSNLVYNYYLIFFPKGWTKKQFKTGNEFWQRLQDNYPAITEHLIQYQQKAEKRYDKGEYWWELRGCDYYNEFEKPKIIYPNICSKPEFAFDNKEYYTNQKCFIIPRDDKYLLGLLNSKLFYFLFENILPKLRGNFYEPSYSYLKTFPIVVPKSKKIKQEVEQLVTDILSIRKNNKKNDIKNIELKIDKLIYKIYNLKDTEIQLIENIINNISNTKKT